jgi:hypothetical protein
MANLSIPTLARVGGTFAKLAPSAWLQSHASAPETGGPATERVRSLGSFTNSLEHPGLRSPQRSAPNPKWGWEGGVSVPPAPWAQRRAARRLQRCGARAPGPGRDHEQKGEAPRGSCPRQRSPGTWPPGVGAGALGFAEVCRPARPRGTPS